jgi:hypothetical protein
MVTGAPMVDTGTDRVMRFSVLIEVKPALSYGYEEEGPASAEEMAEMLREQLQGSQWVDGRAAAQIIDVQVSPAE